jgi:hypothetical protein
MIAVLRCKRAKSSQALAEREVAMADSIKQVVSHLWSSSAAAARPLFGRGRHAPEGLDAHPRVRLQGTTT